MNAAVQPIPKKKRRARPVMAVLLCVIALAGYVWWRPIKAEQELEDASLEQLQQITAANPQNARALYHLGLQLSRKQKSADAFQSLSRAAEMRPDDEEIASAAAGAANAHQGPEAAFRVMNVFLKRHPDSVKMKEQRTSLLSSLQRASDGSAAAKRYKEAIQYYAIWLKEDPTAAAAQQGLQSALKASGSKTKEAGNAFLTLASIYEQQGERTKADEARKQAEQIQNRNSAETSQ